MEELKHPGHLARETFRNVVRDWVRMLSVVALLEQQEERLKDMGHYEAAELVGVSLDAVKGETRRYQDILLPAEDDA